VVRSKSKYFRPHLILNNTIRSEPFSSPKKGGSSPKLPEVDRQKHGNALLSELEAIKTAAERQYQADDFGDEIDFYIKLQFDNSSYSFMRQ